jgi:RNA-splicing ligase RtcB
MADVRIYADIVEVEALEQINTLVAQPAFANCKVRIMPDVHAGAGCVIGFTANLGDKVIPNIVGVDIGCGMRVVELGQIEIDFAKLDEVIRAYVPSGMNVHSIATYPSKALKRLYCYDGLKNTDHLRKSLGTLGGGNHFIEIDEDTRGGKYLVIHTGSRNLGKQVAGYYQNLAVQHIQGLDRLPQLKEELISSLKAQGREREIESALAQLKAEVHDNVPNQLAYLEGEDRENYLHDMQICQEFAVQNRKAIAFVICKHMNWVPQNSFETIHNYIELATNLVRKGAISAKYGEKVLIPMNMRDGCIIGIGKGDDDWNCSAPHGAGRLMSRSKAKDSISLEAFQKSMEGIYTTSVNRNTIDESPMAYKPIEEILRYVEDTIDIVEIIKPIYNFKADN